MSEPLLLIAGVDEVGRGPLLGPVVTAAVIFLPTNVPEGLKDSKKLTDRQRRMLAVEIRRCAVDWALGRAEAAEIDQLNILRATMLAMQRAVAALQIQPDRVLVDGNVVPELPMPAEAIIRGDALVPSISAASILAKVARDDEMRLMAQRYPGYGIERHKGYPTLEHRQALVRLGLLPEHRRSFAPVSQQLRRLEGCA